VLFTVPALDAVYRRDSIEIRGFFIFPFPGLLLIMILTNDGLEGGRGGGFFLYFNSDRYDISGLILVFMGFCLDTE